MSVFEAIEILKNAVPNPTEGLPDELFYYVSSITPLVNVDLLVKDEIGRTLLSWRDDKYNGSGWHIPGGIIRFKESLEMRLQKVAQLEIGVETIKFDPTPIDIKQCIHQERDVRSHFVSILYKCYLPSSFILNNEGRNENDVGYLKWHNFCPINLLRAHKMYEKYI